MKKLKESSHGKKIEKDLYIPTTKLKISDIPSNKSSDKDCLNFINSYYKEYKTQKFEENLNSFMKKKDLNDLTVDEIRAFLFFDVRRAVHTGQPCDIKFHRKLFKLLREKK